MGKLESREKRFNLERRNPGRGSDLDAATGDVKNSEGNRFRAEREDR